MIGMEASDFRLKNAIDFKGPIRIIGGHALVTADLTEINR